MDQNRSSKSNNPGNFANDPNRASEAGKRAHEMGKAHEFTSDEAKQAGEKGGRA